MRAEGTFEEVRVWCAAIVWLVCSYVGCSATLENRETSHLYLPSVRPTQQLWPIKERATTTTTVEQPSARRYTLLGLLGLKRKGNKKSFFLRHILLWVTAANLLLDLYFLCPSSLSCFIADSCRHKIQGFNVTRHRFVRGVFDKC